MEKIFITGTGRCGTTFLIKIFSFLEFNTGYNNDNYSKSIHLHCNAGMERYYNEDYYIIKNPCILSDIKTILEDTSIKIKTVIIPIRDFTASAKSRLKYNNLTGGLWNATDELSQIQFYKDIFANYIYYMTKYEIPTIFIDFDKMINDKKYLFDKLKNILDEKNINYDMFCNVYNEVSLTSKNIK